MKKTLTAIAAATTMVLSTMSPAWAAGEHRTFVETGLQIVEQKSASRDCTFWRGHQSIYGISTTDSVETALDIAVNDKNIAGIRDHNINWFKENEITKDYASKKYRADFNATLAPGATYGVYKMAQCGWIAGDKATNTQVTKARYDKLKAEALAEADKRDGKKPPKGDDPKQDGRGGSSIFDSFSSFSS